MVWYVRQKITIELIYPLTESCYIYTHVDLSVYLFYEHKKKTCWNENAAFQIKTYGVQMVNPKLVTQPVIVHDFFVTPSF